MTKIDAGQKTLADLSNAPLRRKAYIHLDLDCLEPGIVPLQYNEPDGLSVDVVRKCIDEILLRCEVIGFSISEFFQADDDAARDSGAHAVLEIISSLRPAHRSNGE
jgi:arginase family enzyme